MRQSKSTIKDVIDLERLRPPRFEEDAQPGNLHATNMLGIEEVTYTRF